MSTGYYSLLVDWDNDGDFMDAGEDVTTRTLLPLEYFRGRDYASQLTGRSRAGWLTATLNNESGDYSPFNGASPLAGTLLPGRRVQLQGGREAFPYTFPIAFANAPLWTGYVDSISPMKTAPGEVKKAILKAVGPLGYLNQRKLAIPMTTSVTTGTAIGNILDEAGWGADRTLDAGQTTMDRFWVSRQNTISALRLVEESEAGFILEGADGQIVYEDRHHRLGSPHLTSQATFSDAPGATLVYQAIQEEDPLPNIFNIFTASIQDYTVGALAVLWTLSESGASSPKVERAGGTRTWLASYPTPDSGTDAVAVDAWTTPAMTTDYLANSAADGSGTNLSSDIAVAVTKTSSTMKITLTNNNATVDAFMTKLQARGTPVTEDNPVRVEAEDSTSKSTYGERDYPNPAKFLPDTDEGQDWCRFQLAVYKDPLPLLAIRVNGNRDDNHLVEVLARDISDRITVVGQNAAGLSINEDFYIESVRGRIDQGGLLHEATYELSQATAASDWLVLGTSTLGTSTRLAY